jgi:hypothetical protein
MSYCIFIDHKQLCSALLINEARRDRFAAGAQLDERAAATLRRNKAMRSSQLKVARMPVTDADNVVSLGVSQALFKSDQIVAATPSMLFERLFPHVVPQINSEISVFMRVYRWFLKPKE